MVEMPDEVETRDATGEVERRLGAAGWGLFIIWIGIVFLAGIAAWVALVGVGVITLGTQVVRRSVGLAVEAFWLVVGALFVLAGAWELSGTTVPLLPILLIVAGAGLLLSVFRGRRAPPA